MAKWKAGDTIHHFPLKMDGVLYRHNHSSYWVVHFPDGSQRVLLKKNLYRVAVRLPNPGDDGPTVLADLFRLH